MCILHKYKEVKTKHTFIYYECEKCGKRKIFNIDHGCLMGIHLPTLRYNTKWIKGLEE